MRENTGIVAFRRLVVGNRKAFNYLGSTAPTICWMSALSSPMTSLNTRCRSACSDLRYAIWAVVSRPSITKRPGLTGLRYAVAFGTSV